MAEDPTTRTYTLYGCPICATRWWTTDGETNPGHDCPRDMPRDGMQIAAFKQSTRRDPPWPKGRAA